MRYSYQGRNRSGEVLRGEVEATTRGEAAMKVRQKGLWVTSIIPDSNKAIPSERNTVNKVTANSKSTSKIKTLANELVAAKPSTEQLVMLFRELSVLLGAGLPIHKALEILASGAKGAYQQLINELCSQVMKGNSFSSALDKTSLFSASIVSLVRAGETAGTLETLLITIADFEERRFATQEKLKTSLLYPLILLVATIIAFVVMTVFILPTFATMLKNINAELPLITKVLLTTSDVMREYPLLLVAIILFLLCLLTYLYQLPSIRYKLDRLSIYVPIYGELINNSAWNTLCGTVAVLMQNGIPLHLGLTLAGESVKNTYIVAKIRDINVAIKSGKSLYQSLALCPEFSPALRELVLAGEESGTLDMMLERAAYFCGIRAENASARLEALAQPMAIILVGTLVLLFVIAILQPIFSIMDVLT